MQTKAERIVELLTVISNKSGRIKKLKLECGQQATKICVLNLRIEELEAYLVEFGGHKLGCLAIATNNKKYCRCGLEQALKG